MDRAFLKIIIDPRLRLVFANYYIKGLQDLFGRRNVSFASTPFYELDQLNDKEAINNYFALKVIDDKGEIKVVIDFWDKISINHNAYEWCDIYGKFNLNTEHTDQQYLLKTVALGPMIGTKLWSRPQAYLLFLRNYANSRKHVSASLRYILAGYNWQVKRPKLSVYRPGNSEKNYIYFDSQLWQKENAAETTNTWRAAFMRACMAADVHFEGGFFRYEGHPDYEVYKDVLLNTYVPFNEWIRRISRSAVVFNTPSIHGGHGWKLCEFLALGKAIISSPIHNDLPVPLKHEENVHFVHSRGEIKEAIERIVSDDAYRNTLESGARKYYEDHLAPESMVRNLLKGFVTLSDT